MTRLEVLKKDKPRQCLICKSCQTFQRIDKPGTWHCFSCNSEWEPTIGEIGMCKILAERERILIQERELNAKLTMLKKEREPLDVQVRKYLGSKDEVNVSKWNIKWQHRVAHTVGACKFPVVKVNTKKLTSKKIA